jgi:3-dehydroquinate synthase
LKTDFLFNASFPDLKKLTDRKSTVILTDEHVFDAHAAKFRGWNSIVLKAGEEYKIQETADAVIRQLIQLEADRNTFLVGAGGGVITDLTGYIASIYMRGLRFGLIPSTILAMADAAIGGKNGVDVGVYKNLVGTVRQPSFVLYDLDLLNSLPLGEWENGFAEIIKHACIKDARMFHQLEKTDLLSYQSDRELLASLIRRNATIKLNVVRADEFEKAARKLLNFGHTLGHALENQYEVTHGQAISIGMSFACLVSREWFGFSKAGRVEELLTRYGLPVRARFNRDKVWEVLKLDKKRSGKAMDFVLLNDIGKGFIHRVPLERLKKMFYKF